MSEMFSPVGQGRITRRSKNKLNLSFRKTNTGQNGLSYTGPKIWNNLKSVLKSSNNVNSFKQKIKDKSSNDLQNREIALIYIIFPIRPRVFDALGSLGGLIQPPKFISVLDNLEP